MMGMVAAKHGREPATGRNQTEEAERVRLESR